MIIQNMQDKIRKFPTNWNLQIHILHFIKQMIKPIMMTKTQTNITKNNLLRIC